MSFIARPEYRTMEWIVNAGKAMLARLWKTARCTTTLRQSSIAGTFVMAEEAAAAAAAALVVSILGFCLK